MKAAFNLVVALLAVAECGAFSVRNNVVSNGIKAPAVQQRSSMALRAGEIEEVVMTINDAVDVVDVDQVADALSAGLPLPAIGLGVAASVAAAVFSTKGGAPSEQTKPAEPEPEPEPEPIDVSIPYDAAARLAYDTWCAENGKGGFDSKGYAQFKMIYEGMSVTEVIQKKYAREMASYQKQLASLKNGKAEEEAKAAVATPADAGVFFADE
eukprot:CAMPEP_0183308206 /NCGR_PEP_ID=MMETSP0160_2-20130417/20428_1 /TAXON_ID=2839 ORGANISM="Odontella Sinensis, Strain Grunow 1884" /NCGR_SAMPLE_ID=MMETSP0160_2 /ASSEMBLY_ACC=CAM_ASM_000250 /LENGTH=210 /DNA_ID=CAMNT_0025471991 /DNA_START=23 /DNA_END=655 /DNA_ORIENTATION=+